MSTKLRIKQALTSVVLLVAAGAALAGGKTRAEVHAEAVQARADGVLNIVDAHYPVMPAQPSTLTRADVVAATRQARANGELDYTEADYPHIAAVPSTLTRAQVRAEAVAARASGALDVTETGYPQDYSK